MIEWFPNLARTISSPFDNHLIKIKGTIENMREPAGLQDIKHTSGILHAEVATAKEGLHLFIRYHQEGVRFCMCCCGVLGRQIECWRLLCRHALRLALRVDPYRCLESLMASVHCHLTAFLSGFEGNCSRCGHPALRSSYTFISPSPALA